MSEMTSFFTLLLYMYHFYNLTFSKKVTTTFEEIVIKLLRCRLNTFILYYIPINYNLFFSGIIY